MLPLRRKATKDNFSPFTSNGLPVWKRTIDLVCCAIALPFLAVLALIMTAITKLLAPGPVLFRQERVGHYGRRFRIFKFRTMYVNADTRGHQDYFKELISTNAPMAKLDSQGDARLIPGMRFLRAAGVDELPQIINVIRGEMTIVGPRPCIQSEYDEYLPWQRQRCQAVPGLTGLWQVSGKNRTTFDQMIRLDIRYAQNVSLWRDIRIILFTVPAILIQLKETRLARKTAPVGQPVPAISAANKAA
jgi:lipopolysaccharide/colanic/teichoic acid biosynthesis glycosyltransferase